MHRSGYAQERVYPVQDSPAPRLVFAYSHVRVEKSQPRPDWHSSEVWHGPVSPDFAVQMEFTQRLVSHSEPLWQLWPPPFSAAQMAGLNE